MKWQPIETAPKDGAAVLVWNDVTGAYRSHWLEINGTGQWPLYGWVLGECGTWYPNPTHWMPLPEPPA